MTHPTSNVRTLTEYVPSVRDIPGVKRSPVLAERNLSGKWIPPLAVYVARDVDREIERLRSAMIRAYGIWSQFQGDTCMASNGMADVLNDALSGDGSQVETSPNELTEAEKLLQAWADPLPPNGRLYWAHVEKAREYFRRRGSTETSTQVDRPVTGKQHEGDCWDAQEQIDRLRTDYAIQRAEVNQLRYALSWISVGEGRAGWRGHVVHANEALAGGPVPLTEEITPERHPFSRNTGTDRAIDQWVFEKPTNCPEPSAAAHPGSSPIGDANVGSNPTGATPRNTYVHADGSRQEIHLLGDSGLVCEKASAPQSLPMATISAICHEISGTCVYVLKDVPGACTIENCSAVRAYLGSPVLKATRDPPGSYRDATGELVLPQVPVRCINFPCQLRAGHTGPCDSSPNGKEGPL